MIPFFTRSNPIVMTKQIPRIAPTPVHMYVLRSEMMGLLLCGAKLPPSDRIRDVPDPPNMVSISQGSSELLNRQVPK